MRSLRCMIAIALVASFGGIPPAAASCVMTPGPAGTAVGHMAQAHAHHAPDAPPSSEPTHRQASTHPDSGCDLMLACAAAAPTVAVAVVPAVPFTAESSIVSPGAAHASPSLASEPPPPRPHLI